MSKIKLKEIADAIREKDGTTEPIVANDFAARIRAISGSENLDAELNAQDELLGRLEENINAFPDVPEWQPNPTWWDIEKVLAEDTRDYPTKVIILLYSNDIEEQTFDYGANAYATSDGAFYELNTGNVTHNWDLTKDKPCMVDGVEQYKTRYVIAYFNSGKYALLSKHYNFIYVDMKTEEGLLTSQSSVFTNCYSLQGVKKCKKHNKENFVSMFKGCYSLQNTPELDTSNGTNFSSMFYDCSSLRTIPQLDTSSGTNFDSMFYGCKNLKTIPELDTSNATRISSMFYGCASLQTIPQLDTSNVTNFEYMFKGCYSLQNTPELDTSNGTNFSSMFYDCASLQTIPQLDTSSGTTFDSMFYGCASLQTVPQLDTSNSTRFSSMFFNCDNLQNIPEFDARNVTHFSSMFRNCYNLSTISGLNLINAKAIDGIFTSCTALENLTLKNIKLSLIIGSGTSWGHLLTLDSLLNTIKELWDNTSGTSTLTLTVGSANLTKLANVYVKLVDITDEMRAEDEYIDNKKPFVVCESTDEGAMLITEYVTTVKNWQIK